MSTNAEARCYTEGHVWSGWGLWEALMPSYPVSYRMGEQPCSVEMKKRRWRECRRCGACQMQDGGGVITDGVR